MYIFVLGGKMSTQAIIKLIAIIVITVAMVACGNGGGSSNSSSSQTLYIAGAAGTGGGLFSYANGNITTIESEIGINGNSNFFGGGGNFVSMVASGNILYIGGWDHLGGGGFYSYNTATQSFAAVESGIGIGAPIFSLAVGNDGMIYLGGADYSSSTIPSGGLYAYNPTTDILTMIESGIGAANGDNAIKALAVGNDGIVYVGGYDGTGQGGLYSYNPTSGSFATLESGVGNSAIKALAVADDGTIYVGGNDSSGSGGLYSYSPSTTNLTMLESGLGTSVSYLVYNTATLYLNVSGTDVYSYADGALNFIATYQGSSYIPIAINNSLLYMGGIANGNNFGGINIFSSYTTAMQVVTWFGASPAPEVTALVFQ